jgi:hypothetical protein
MLESMIGPDMIKKMMAKASSLISVILAWIGLIMVMMTSFISADIIDSNTGKTVGQHLLIAHAQFWPMFVAFACAGAALVVGGKKTKINLAWITFVAPLWVMLNAIFGWVLPPAGSGMGEMIGPLMASITAVGAFMAVLGGLCGLLGVGKYLS